MSKFEGIRRDFLRITGGTCAKGIFIANAKSVVAKNITATVAEGKLLNLWKVPGKGLEGAATIYEPKPIPQSSARNTSSPSSPRDDHADRSPQEHLPCCTG
jgi:hypothetical protein